ncbi:hypothetical protein D3870_07870 [Noviherbaspirillum cavernae]|uniref:Uncharacterized protein n=2 Tax=Noviherbaspirillum cavernae TaxID=2320862 RepID=A0A418X0E7_9BURK|nr:hypothetical protein D3870_07870 [Noviherbaspirillum cavernae]
MRESWPWVVGPLAIGFMTPSLVVFVLAVGVGGQTIGPAFKDILGRQFAEGHNLFLLAVWSLIPFVVLSAILLFLPAGFSRRRVAWLSIFGLLGALGLMVPIHWSVWEPVYSGRDVSSTAVVAFVPLPFMCVFTMFLGLGVGWLVTKAPWFQLERPGAIGTKPAAPDRGGK